MTIFIMRGLPGSGKTVWARKLVDDNDGQVKRVGKDDLRAMMDNGKWSKENEEFVNRMQDFIIMSAVLTKHDVVVDNTNLTQAHEEHIKKLFEGIVVPGKLDVDFQIKSFMDVPIETCIERDKKREKPVGEKVIRDMAKKYQKENRT